VGVDGERELTQLLGLALADERGRVGRIASLDHATDDIGSGGVDQQRQLVEVLLGLVGGLGCHGDPDEDDPLSEGAFDQLGHATSMSAMCTAGPMRCTSPPSIPMPSSTTAEPPGMCTVTRSPTSPQRCAAHAAAHAPVPHACVSPTPRSTTRIVNASSPGPPRTNSTLRSVMAKPSAAASSAARSGYSATRCGLPTA